MRIIFLFKFSIDSIEVWYLNDGGKEFENRTNFSSLPLLEFKLFNDFDSFLESNLKKVAEFRDKLQQGVNKNSIQITSGVLFSHSINKILIKSIKEILKHYGFLNVREIVFSKYLPCSYPSALLLESLSESGLSISLFNKSDGKVIDGFRFSNIDLDPRIQILTDLIFDEIQEKESHHAYSRERERDAIVLVSKKLLALNSDESIYTDKIILSDGFNTQFSIAAIKLRLKLEKDNPLENSLLPILFNLLDKHGLDIYRCDLILSGSHIGRAFIIQMLEKKFPNIHVLSNLERKIIIQQIFQDLASVQELTAIKNSDNSKPPRKSHKKDDDYVASSAINVNAVKSKKPLASTNLEVALLDPEPQSLDEYSYPEPPPMFSQMLSTNGRIRRLEYVISSTLLAVLISYLMDWVAVSESRSYVLLPIYFLLWVQGAKRCHDLNKPAWYQLIPLYFFALLFQSGDPMENKYGYPPK